MNKTRTSLTFALTFSLIFLASFIVSCSQQSNLKKEGGSNLPDPSKQTALDAELLLNSAEQTSTPNRNKLCLQTAYIFIKNKQFSQANHILENLDPTSFNKNLSAIYTTQTAEILLQKQQSKTAINLLNKNIKPSTLNIEGQKLFSEVMAKALFQN